jgi:hypothetical protein
VDTSAAASRVRAIAATVRDLQGRVRDGLWQPTLVGRDNVVFEQLVFEASTIIARGPVHCRGHAKELAQVVRTARNPLDQANGLAGIQRARLILEAASIDLEIADEPHQVASKPSHHFVDPARLTALRAIRSADFDLSRLIRLLEELELSYQGGAYLAVAALTRALIDHVPPIFGAETFEGVAKNQKGGKSFSASMQLLQGSARKIGDAHLHTRIRSRESLPTRTQVAFSHDIDVLLAEILRILA